MPFAKSDAAVVAAAGDTDRTAFLLAAANTIGKSRRDGDVVDLRRRLVVPGTPRRSAIHRNQRTLITDQKNNVGIIGIDPKILVVVAAGCAAKSRPGLAAIVGAHGDRAGAIYDVRIFGIDAGHGKVAAADAARRPRVVGDLRPGVAGIVGAVDAQRARRGGDGGIQTARAAGSDGNVDLRKILGQAVGKRMPGGAAIGGFE